MDKHRQIAFIAAFILALLIMMVGKACTDSAVKKRSKPVQSSTSQSTPAYDYNSYNNYNNNYNNSYNNTPQQTTPPQQTEPPVGYVTNMFGEVVGTAEPVVPDIQPETDENGVYIEEPKIQTTTQERSILEQYNKNKQGNVVPETKNNDNYQIPSEINITIH